MLAAVPDARHFTEELNLLKDRLIHMGGLAQARVADGLNALVDADKHKVQKLINGDDVLNKLQLEIDDRCFKLLALNQPVATDLRLIVSAIKISADLERVGDLAVNIAEATVPYLGYQPVKALIDLPRMGEIAQQMLASALTAFLTNNAEAAKSVLAADDRLDALKDQVFRELLTYMLGNAETIAPAVELILISRHLERIGDHATNIAEDVIFITEARDVRHSRRK